MPVGWLDVSALCFMEWVQWKINEASVAVINPTKQHLFTVEDWETQSLLFSLSASSYVFLAIFRIKVFLFKGIAIAVSPVCFYTHSDVCTMHVCLGTCCVCACTCIVRVCVRVSFVCVCTCLHVSCVCECVCACVRVCVRVCVWRVHSQWDLMLRLDLFNKTNKNQ